MLCETCQQAEATIHTLDLDNDGKYSQRHLCEKCAMGAGPEAQNSSKVFKFFGQIIAQAEGGSGESSDVAAGVKCQGCGMTYEQFQHNRRLGCARCYDTFESDLEQIFLRVQEKAIHCGKVPGRPHAPPPSPMELRRLREQLQRAVQEERFEEAAQYRDQIQKLSGDVDDSAESL